MTEKKIKKNRNFYVNVQQSVTQLTTFFISNSNFTEIEYIDSRYKNNNYVFHYCVII